MLQSLNIELEDTIINFRYQGSDDIIYKTKINNFEENTGLTISNPHNNIPAYVLQLSQYGSDIRCGHIIDNVAGYLISLNLEAILLIVDFADVNSVSKNFAEEYIKFILATKSKVISINQNTNITNTLSDYVESIIDVQEVVQE